MTESKATLIFIPDISGFTEFVSNTEISHSRHIISELLEIIINSDITGMIVSEVEGDAVLCYNDDDPSLTDLINQCQHTFKNFHSHLRRYDTERICRCGACETASQLSLKFIIHAGQVEKIQIKDHEKLHGSDVILAHRLLKNSIADREYVLFTDNIQPDNDTLDPDAPDRLEIRHGKDSFDNLGEVSYSYISLRKLHTRLPDAPPVTFPELSQEKIKSESTIFASVDRVYENFTSFEKRLEWNEDIKDIVMHGKGLNQTGTLHTCLVGPYTLDIESLGRLENKDQIVYGERLNEFKGLRDIISIYTFEKKGDRTVVRVEVDFKIKSFFGRIMKSTVRKMLQKQTEDGLNKLKKVSEENAG